jgi:hypothetical protein
MLSYVSIFSFWKFLESSLFLDHKDCLISPPVLTLCFFLFYFNLCLLVHWCGIQDLTSFFSKYWDNFSKKKKINPTIPIDLVVIPLRLIKLPQRYGVLGCITFCHYIFYQALHTWRGREVSIFTSLHIIDSLGCSFLSTDLHKVSGFLKISAWDFDWSCIAILYWIENNLHPCTMKPSNQRTERSSIYVDL